MSNHKRMRDALRLKIEIPSEIFLTRVFVTLYALLVELPDYPPSHIVPETAWVDEIVFWVGHVKGTALKGDNRPNL